MTQEEGFIRSIVDSPGDDTPRLVYADWLDDRSDPRGPYLRAEREWAEPWRSGERPADSPELRELARGLDPVWVARVSRPPAGVCCEHVGFEQRRPPTTPRALDAIERRFNLRLPDDYKAFLLNYNAVWSDSAFYRSRGGYCYPLLYIFAVNDPDGAPYGGPGDDFAPRWHLQQIDLPWRLLQIELGHSVPDWDDPIYQDFIPILCNDEEPDGEASWLSLGVRGTSLGRVVDFGYAPGENVLAVLPVAPSFAAFLADLVPTAAARPRLSTRRRLFEP